MINTSERLSNNLLKPWTAHGILLFRGTLHCVEVEVPLLALDAEELARAVASNTEYIKNPGYPKEALGPGVSVERHCEISAAWRRELTIADHDLTLAAALLARRACTSPFRVTVAAQDQYVARYLWRGGTAQGDPTQAEFLFVVDGPSPTVYVASEALAAVTRYMGAEYLSVRVSQDELRLRIRDVTERLEQDKSLAPRSLTNMEDWFTHRKIDVGDKAKNENGE